MAARAACDGRAQEAEAAAEAEERTASDHSSEGDASDEEEGLECGMCEDMVPDVFCGDCSKYLCEGCHAKRRGAHAKEHLVCTVEEHRKELLHRRRSSSFRCASGSVCGLRLMHTTGSAERMCDALLLWAQLACALGLR